MTWSNTKIVFSIDYLSTAAEARQAHLVHSENRRSLWPAYTHTFSLLTGCSRCWWLLYALNLDKFKITTCYCVKKQIYFKRVLLFCSELSIGLFIFEYIPEGKWADPGGTAIPGQPVEKSEQAPESSPSSKNQFNIIVVQCTTYQILS